MSEARTLEELLAEVAEGVRPPERLSIVEAAAKHRRINNPAVWVGPWSPDLTPYMNEVQEVLQSLEFTACVFVGPAQSGKARTLDTPIPTPTGWTTMGALSVGDTIFDESGKPCRVTFATEAMHDHTVYRITFDDGSNADADAGHKWYVETKDNGKKVVTTEQMLPDYRVPIRSKPGKTRARYSVPVAKPLDMPLENLPIPPYLLGLWLGDGDVQKARLELHREDAKHFTRHLARRGVTLVPCKEEHPESGSRPFKAVIGSLGLVTALKGIGLRETPTRLRKRIPAKYLRAYTRQRQELLQGLMDSDGEVIKGKRGCIFNTSNPDLRDDVYELLVSLGYKVRVSSKIPTYTYQGEKRTGKEAYRLSFCVDRGEDVFSLPRYLDAINAIATRPRLGQTNRRWVERIERIESVPVRCIQVDSPSHLFLADRAMIPTHNTDVILNWANHSVIYDPMDFMAIHPTQVAARDFSRRRIDRLHRESAEMRKRLVPKRESDSVYYKQYRNGMIMNQSWPTISELSGRPIGRLWLTDRDRMTDDVDGEGDPFDLARKRSTTFGRYGMTVAESSPGRDVTNPKWMPSLPHEAPPTTGILSLYNRGDRRRWYWRCKGCAGRFEPSFELVSYDGEADAMTAAETAVMACPHCGQVHDHEDKAGLNLDGVWLKAGQHFDAEDRVAGTAVRSDIASFWLPGVAAAFADWRILVLNYIKAEEEYERTGDQGALRTTVNTDQGYPYTPKGMESDRLPETLKSRAADLGEKQVAPGTRFLLATVDVQKNRFEVQVQGVGVGTDIYVVDRFAIRKSERVDDDGDPWPVNPGSYPEDWELLRAKVMERSYPLGDGSGRRMMIKLTACDSGGVTGVTTRAYAFYRDLKATGDHQRFILIKGAASKSAPRVHLSYPDSERKDRHAGARGEIPVLLINGNLLKDQLNTMLDRVDPYGGMIHFPDWLPDTFYTELTAEIRTEKGWENPRKLRNEAWDLLVYTLALCRSHFIRAEFIDWENPPSWAAEWDTNDLIFDPDVNKPFEKQPRGGYDFSKYAEALA